MLLSPQNSPFTQRPRASAPALPRARPCLPQAQDRAALFSWLWFFTFTGESAFGQKKWCAQPGVSKLGSVCP